MAISWQFSGSVGGEQSFSPSFSLSWIPPRTRQSNSSLLISCRKLNIHHSAALRAFLLLNGKVLNRYDLLSDLVSLLLIKGTKEELVTTVTPVLC